MSEKSRSLKGTVQVFDPDDGFGYIISSEGERFSVHWGDIDRDSMGESEPLLAEGDAVAFDPYWGEGCPQATNVCKLGKTN